MASYLKARKATNPDNTLIIHSGDMIGGSSPVSALLRDEPTVEIMEAIGFDVGTVGNHEFDKGTQEFLWR
ncbi:UNVERIFIED_ORG: 2',3'-cyclic-nucleotide 2'-phosphodiesterase (5'-nucleotidase family) [Peribacillus simplex]